MVKHSGNIFSVMAHTYSVMVPSHWCIGGEYIGSSANFSTYWIIYQFPHLLGGVVWVVYIRKIGQHVPVFAGAELFIFVHVSVFIINEFRTSWGDGKVFVGLHSIYSSMTIRPAVCPSNNARPRNTKHGIQIHLGKTVCIKSRSL